MILKLQQDDESLGVGGSGNLSSVCKNSAWWAMGFETQVSQATEQSESPGLATEGGNGTQEKKIPCSSHLDTGL